MLRVFLTVAALLSPITLLAQGDPLTEFSSSDGEMNAAMATAQDTLPLFLANVTDDEGFNTGNTSLKVAFDTQMGPEIIWVGPFVWDGDQRMAGLLRNQPNFMDGLNAGDRVDFTVEMVRDWSFITDEGILFGNYTTRVMIPELDDATAEQLSAVLSADPVPSDW